MSIEDDFQKVVEAIRKFTRCNVCGKPTEVAFCLCADHSDEEYKWLRDENARLSGHRADLLAARSKMFDVEELELSMRGYNILTKQLNLKHIALVLQVCLGDPKFIQARMRKKGAKGFGIRSARELEDCLIHWIAELQKMYYYEG